MKTIVIATANPNKLKEIQAINTYKDINFSIVEGDFSPEETGSTYEENAYIKASAASKIMTTFCLADDSGLSVDALDGAPGLYSARYAGTQSEKINKLLKNMKNIEPKNRTAHFVSSMVLVDGQGKILHRTVGTVNGIITTTPRGTNGFGYDPLFLIPEYNLTMAEINSEIKNKISHRANALLPMLRWIHENIL